MSLFRRRRDDVVEEPVPETPAGPATRGDVAQRLLATEPTTGRALADSLLPTVRLAIRKEPDAAIDVAESKFGGAPDLPVGTFWPSCTPPGGEKRYLQFYAQVDLAVAAAAVPGEADWAFPADGLLSFFADLDAGEVVVHYSPAESQFSRCGLRIPPLPTAQLHPLGTWTWSPSPNGSGITALGQQEEADLILRVPDRYVISGHHQIGGHVGGIDGAVLLQFDSDPTLELEHGRLVWTVPAADLASRTWSNATLHVLA